MKKNNMKKILTFLAFFFLWVVHIFTFPYAGFAWWGGDVWNNENYTMYSSRNIGQANGYFNVTGSNLFTACQDLNANLKATQRDGGSLGGIPSNINYARGWMLDSNKSSSITQWDYDNRNSSTSPGRCVLWDTRNPTNPTNPWLGAGISINGQNTQLRSHNSGWDPSWHDYTQVNIYRKTSGTSTWQRVQSYSGLSNNDAYNTRVFQYFNTNYTTRRNYTQDGDSIREFSVGNYLFYIEYIQNDGSIFKSYYTEGFVSIFTSIVDSIRYRATKNSWEEDFYQMHPQNDWYNAGSHNGEMFFFDAGMSGLQSIRVRYQYRTLSNTWTPGTWSSMTDLVNATSDSSFVWRRFTDIDPTSSWRGRLSTFNRAFTIPNIGNRNLQYRYTVDIRDKAGNRVYADYPEFLMLDGTTPDLNIVSSSHQNNIYSSQSRINVTLDVLNGGPSDVNTYYCFSTSSTCNPSNRRMTTLWQNHDRNLTITKSTGTYYLRARVCDTGGCSAIKQYIFKIDTTLPGATVRYYNESGANVTGKVTRGDWFKENITAIISCSDAHSGCNMSSIPTGWTANSAANTFSRTFSSVWTPGNVVIRDRAGNSRTVSFARINIDKNSPTYTINYSTVTWGSYTPGTWSNQDIRVTVTCNDTGGSGCQTATFRNWTRSGNSYSRVFSSSQNSFNLWTFRDTAWNISSTISIWDIRIDKSIPTPPVITSSVWTSGATSSQNSSTITITSQAVPTNASPRTTQWCIGTTCSPSTNYNTPFNRTFTPGTYTIQARTCTAARNCSSISTFRITIILWNSCDTQPSISNATFVIGSPTQIAQEWQNTNAANACYYSCNPWFSGNNCEIVSLDILPINIKIIGLTSSYNYNTNLTEVNNVGPINKVAFREKIQKDVISKVKIVAHTSSVETISNLSGANWASLSTSGTKLLSDTVLYFNSSRVTLSGGSISGNKTLVVNGWDIYISGNIRGNGVLGIIALEENGVGGNIYINPGVTDIHASMYADKSLLNYDGSTTDISESQRKNQLYILGSIFSENTLWGMLFTPVQCPFYITSCTSSNAWKYDFNVLRTYHLTQEQDASWTVIDEYPADGWLSSYVGTSSRGSRADLYQYPLIIEYNQKLQITPPPFFE